MAIRRLFRFCSNSSTATDPVFIRRLRLILPVTVSRNQLSRARDDAAALDLPGQIQMEQRVGTGPVGDPSGPAWLTGWGTGDSEGV